MNYIEFLFDINKYGRDRMDLFDDIGNILEKVFNIKAHRILVLIPEGLALFKNIEVSMGFINIKGVDYLILAKDIDNTYYIDLSKYHIFNINKR